MVELLMTLIAHRKTVVKWLKGLAIAFLLLWGITTHIENKKLSEGLEIA